MSAVRYFEDIRQGELGELGSVTLDASEMLDYARRYDPQPAYLEAGEEGLEASPWYLCCIFMRLYASEFLNRHAAIVSPGLERLQWHRPVHAGETLRGRYEVLDVRRSRSKPDRGHSRGRGTLEGGDGRPVLELEAVNFFWTRAAG